MPSSYLTTGEFAAFGVRANATAALVTQASALIDSHLHRPEGMVYATDLNGMPCHMAAAEPTLPLALAAPAIAGSNVTLQVTPPMGLPPDMIGEVLVLDAGVAGKTEAAVITALPAPGQITVDKLATGHVATATAQLGLVVREELSMPHGRSIARVTRPNAVRLLALQGRFGYARRSQQVAGYFEEFNLLAAVGAFGGPPMWSPVAVANTYISPATREVWVPASMLQATFSDVRIHYVAGFAAAPQPLKMATALLVNQLVDSNGLSDAFSKAVAGDQQLTRFAERLFDEGVRQLLAPYRATALF